MNICWKCQHWQKCFKNRYGNQKQDYMKKINRKRDSWGQFVIYVEECEKYLHERQEVDIITGKERVYDIMYRVENYYNNSLGK